MPVPGDPYRVLGLPPGASLDEIKRAYRSLAKRYHPDSAGEAQVKRFLALQAAYEALLRSHAAAGKRRAATHPTARQAAQQAARQADRQAERPAWEADPDRARATRQRYGAGCRAGSDRTWGRPADRTAGGTAGGRTRDAAQPGGSASRAGPSGSAWDAGRARPVARPGSTSYDGADDEPRHPHWDGATWYGAASGTYWTVNPKEYADPRKHGPEYAARGPRRAEAGWSAGEEAPPADGARSRGAPAGVHGAGDGGGPRRPAAPSGRTAPGHGDAPAAAGEAPAAAGDAPVHRAGARPSGAGDRPVRAGAAAVRFPPASGRSGARPRQEAAGRGAAARPARLPARLVAAVLAWPPLGLVAATLFGEVTGCGRFAVTCPPYAGPAAWILQAAIVAALLAAPAIARPAAVGTLAVAAAAIPAAAILSAAGGRKGAARRRPHASRRFPRRRLAGRGRARGDRTRTAPGLARPRTMSAP